MICAHFNYSCFYPHRYFLAQEPKDTSCFRDSYSCWALKIAERDGKVHDIRCLVSEEQIQCVLLKSCSSKRGGKYLPCMFSHINTDNGRKKKSMLRFPIQWSLKKLFLWVTSRSSHNCVQRLDSSLSLEGWSNRRFLYDDSSSRTYFFVFFNGQVICFCHRIGDNICILDLYFLSCVICTCVQSSNTAHFESVCYV